MKLLLILCAVLLLVGCGGSGPNDTDADQVTAGAMTIGAAVQAAGVERRKRAMYAVPGVDPLLAAIQLMDFGEQQFAVYFLSKRQTRELHGWFYRYYPETGIYLAVIDWRVYVMGGAFGPEVTYVGPLTDFVTIPGASDVLTATRLAQCPNASVVEAPNFFSCMNGGAVGTQLFDATRACTLTIAVDGTVVVESGEARFELTAADTGRVLYSKSRSGSSGYFDVSIYSASSLRPYLTIGIESTFIAGRDFFSVGGEVQVSVRQLFPEASLSCRFDLRTS